MKKIIFSLERIYIGYEIPIHYYNKSGILQHSQGFQDQKDDPFFTDKQLYDQLHKIAIETEHPVLYREEQIIYCVYADKNRNCFIWGPIITEEISKLDLLNYRKKHHITNNKFKLRRLIFTKFLNCVCTSVLFIDGKNYTELEVVRLNTENGFEANIIENDYMTYVVENAEKEIYRINYEQELKWLDSIRSGRYERAGQNVSDMNPDKVGKLASSSFKQLEYLCVCEITLATRAAIEGGISPLEAYTISDLYLQKLEKCKSQLEIMLLLDSVVLALTKRIQERVTEKSGYDYIEKCKDYITQHVNKKITVAEIAGKIAINRSYLSHRFAVLEGITIQHYILKEKLKAVANMLRFSEYDIAAISEYLAFSSQSNMGRQFKLHYGISPGEYRKKYQIVDFNSKKKQVE